MSPSLTSHLSDDGNRLTIQIRGRFDFHLHKPFREAYKSQPEKLAYVVDLRGADYMDSSALGMLLLLREHAGGDRSRVRLVGANEEIGKILAISNFDELFDIG